MSSQDDANSPEEQEAMTTADVLRDEYCEGARAAGMMLAALFKEQGVMLGAAGEQASVDAYNGYRAEAGVPRLSAAEERAFRAAFRRACAEAMRLEW